MHDIDPARDHVTMTDFAHARKTMVDNQLRTSGITDRRLLAAMGEVPRESFVPGPLHALAYTDVDLRLDTKRKLGAPAPFAKLVQLAAVEHTDRVLDVGCGTGYSAVVLARLAQHVVAVDDDAVLIARARAALAAAGASNVTLVEGPLTTAGASHGPYDVIVVEGDVEDVPQALLDQLKPDGRLVALLAPAGHPAVAHLFVRSASGIAASPAFDARLPRLARPADDAFVF
jgi:protein-L-isoaspartate(D-aspartate) O-methyltransferase